MKSAITLIGLAILVPGWVLVGAMVGLEPTHWSGPRLSDASLLPLVLLHSKAAPEPANVLLSRARDQEELGSAQDLAPSYWDDGAGEVVLGAATADGEVLRRGLGENAGTPYRIERRPHSAQALEEIQHAVLPWVEAGALMSSVDAEHNRVELTVTKLGHPLFAELHARYGDAVEVRFAPFQPVASTLELRLGQPAPPAPTADRRDPFGSWLTLLTGFPWYIAGSLGVVAGLWLLPSLVRRQDSFRRKVKSDFTMSRKES